MIVYGCRRFAGLFGIPRRREDLYECRGGGLRLLGLNVRIESAGDFT